VVGDVDQVQIRVATADGAVPPRTAAETW